MWAYWFLFVIAAWRANDRLTATANWSKWWRFMFIVLVLMIGLRHEVGGDWFAYIDHIYTASFDTLQEATSKGDPAYNALNWLAAWLDQGPYFVNIVCAVIFAWGLLVFCRAQPLPWLALVVAVPYLVTVVAMGYTRQGVAIGLVMFGLVALADRKIFRFVLFVFLAAAFHKSAVIMITLALLAGAKNRLWTALWVSVTSLVFYVLFLQESIDSLYINYIGREYESSGAAIRVAMNVVPAVVFLLLRKRFAMDAHVRKFWTWMSLGALFFVGLLVVSPSSTAVDRVALYWIPLQLVVLSRLPIAMTRYRELSFVWTRLIIFYSASVLFVWLFFAGHAYLWLPYQFYPWVLLWQ